MKFLVKYALKLDFGWRFVDFEEKKREISIILRERAGFDFCEWRRIEKKTNWFNSFCTMISRFWKRISRFRMLISRYWKWYRDIQNEKYSLINFTSYRVTNIDPYRDMVFSVISRFWKWISRYGWRYRDINNGKNSLSNLTPYRDEDIAIFKGDIAIWPFDIAIS